MLLLFQSWLQCLNALSQLMKNLRNNCIVQAFKTGLCKSAEETKSPVNL